MALERGAERIQLECEVLPRPSEVLLELLARRFQGRCIHNESDSLRAVL